MERKSGRDGEQRERRRLTTVPRIDRGRGTSIAAYFNLSVNDRRELENYLNSNDISLSALVRRLVLAELFTGGLFPRA